MCESRMKINKKSKLKDAECPKCNFTAWYYEEQTKMKHKVFEDYFDKWVKILGKYYNLNYVDGFAGIGTYYDNKGNFYFGSPIIAADDIINNKKKATLMLVDKDKKVIKNLKKVVKHKGLDDSENLKIFFICDDFNKTINEILRTTKDSVAPTFIFIDPFGFGDVKYKTIRNIMEKISKAEILITFMYNAIQRFLKETKLSKTFDEVFGTDEWRNIIELPKKEREEKLIALYVSQVKKISKYGYPYRLTFHHKRMTYYYLIHLTAHLKGSTIMKSSFAKYSHGRPEWLGIYGNQMKLTEMGTAKLDGIKKCLINKYNKKKITFQQIIEENIDTTPYLESEIRNAIKKLEEGGFAYVERFPKLTEKRRELSTSIKENDIIYFNAFPSIKRKSLLYKTKVEYGNFTINHVLGCSHGCNYPCYARMLAVKYGKVKDYEDWIHPKIVSNALELLDKEIPKYKKEIDFVHLSFTTDPFMYDIANKRLYPWIKDLTLRIIEKLNQNEIKVTVLTKGIFPKELTDFKRFSKKNEYGITLVSLDKNFKKKYEPFSASFKDRINSLKYLHENGLKTWISIEPYPTPNLDPSANNIAKILNNIKFVNKIIFGKLNYNSDVYRFKNSTKFYKECAKKVIDFCKKNDIQYHIKEGTPYNNKKTQNIFNSYKISLKG